MPAENTPSQPDPVIRLFKSDFLEFFTHISPVAVLVVFLPLIGFLLWRAASVNSTAWWNVPLAFLIGLAVWPLVEYLLHRFVFHFKPANPSERMQRFLFLMHGVHHAQPREKTRLVMPPVVSLPMAALFYGLFWLVIGKLLGAPGYVDGIAGGFLFGYVLYDMTHYALHHFSLKGAYFRKLRRHHMAHHFKTHDAKYGVSTWFWDDVFKTNPVE
jgi:sterol desaturase/sphingolipid hydroxylase (fatty acid hydroxylase superfamily)